ncbi:hypothetical protein [Mycolicibacterium lutetiense]
MRTLLMIGAVPLVAIAGAAPVSACPGQAGLGEPFSVAGGPYVGRWGAHGEKMIVHADGTGLWSNSERSMNFRMGEVQAVGQPNTAYGDITSGGYAEPGSFITMQIVDDGEGLLLSFANGDEQFPFCKWVNGSYPNNSECGA